MPVTDRERQTMIENAIAAALGQPLKAPSELKEKRQAESEARKAARIARHRGNDAARKARDRRGEPTKTQQGEPKAPPQAREGRPLIEYDQAIADEIIMRLRCGMTLTRICKGHGFPSYNVVMRWCDQSESFRDAVRRAREDGATTQIDIAADVVEDADTKESAYIARVRADILLKVASKRNPREFSDRVEHVGKVQHEHTHTITDERRASALALMLNREAIKGGASLADLLDGLKRSEQAKLIEVRPTQAESAEKGRNAEPSSPSGISGEGGGGGEILNRSLYEGGTRSAHK